MALLVPDCGRAGQADGLALGRDEPEFELALGGKDGARFEIDGVVRRVEPHMVNGRIGRLISFRSVCGPSEGGVSRCIRRKEVLKNKIIVTTS